MGSQSRIMLIFLLALNVLNFFTIADSTPNFSDCMKNPFATGCRGISAKRSQQISDIPNMFAASQAAAALESQLNTNSDKILGRSGSNWLESIKSIKQQASKGYNSNSKQPVVEITRIFLANDDADQPSLPVSSRSFRGNERILALD